MRSFHFVIRICLREFSYLVINSFLALTAAEATLPLSLPEFLRRKQVAEEVVGLGISPSVIHALVLDEPLELDCSPNPLCVLLSHVRVIHHTSFALGGLHSFPTSCEFPFSGGTFDHPLLEIPVNGAFHHHRLLDRFHRLPGIVGEFLQLLSPDLKHFSHESVHQLCKPRELLVNFFLCFDGCLDHLHELSVLWPFG